MRGKRFACIVILRGNHWSFSLRTLLERVDALLSTDCDSDEPPKLAEQEQAVEQPVLEPTPKKKSDAKKKKTKSKALQKQKTKASLERAVSNKLFKCQELLQRALSSDAQ